MKLVKERNETDKGKCKHQLREREKWERERI